MKYFSVWLPVCWIIVATAGWADSTVDETPHGYLGVEAGPSLFTGKTYVVDGVTGATLPQTQNRWHEINGTVSVYADLGIPTYDGALHGTLGLRQTVELSLPSHVYDMTLFVRYRYRLLTSRLIWEPWLGVGVGFHLAPDIARGVFFQLPVGIGVDVFLSQQVGITCLIHLNSLNPAGPVRRVTSDVSANLHRYRFDSYMLKFGVVYRFY